MKEYIIYTDGSDFKHTSRRLGIGGVIIDPSDRTENMFGKKIGEFSEELDRDDIKRDYNTDECSNPFAELIATYRALVRFSHFFKPGDKIIMKADYEGVGKWLRGEWKAKAPYIAKAKEQILSITNISPWRIEYQWVKGHQSIFDADSYWNNEVDKLAKGI